MSSSLFDRYNLRPQERRLLVIVLSAVFVVVNFVFVWPHFGDWAAAAAELSKARRTLATYQTELAHKGTNQKKLQQLEGKGLSVLPEQQANSLQRYIRTQAARSHVTISGLHPISQSSVVNTNSYFEEQRVKITITTTDKELVDFLVALGSDNSMIRVRELMLRPDTSHTKLEGTLTLVASYQKNHPHGAPRKPSASARRSRPSSSRRP